MHCVKKLTDDMYWVGASDRSLALFEKVYPVPDGMSYNSYLLLDEKTVLFDTVDKSVSGQFLDNIKYLLNGRNLNYVVVNHMEPDHCATLEEVVRRYPDVKVIGTAKTIAMIKQFFEFDIDGRALAVKEGDEFSSGKHKFTFVMAPMVHWPEVMVTYDTTDKILYSADAFGTFGAVNGNIFADEVDFENKRLDEARRYYTNIVGKYGPQVQSLLKKASGIEIAMLCPLHGPVWRKNIEWFIDKYDKWSRYEPEEKAVMIAYASVYGGTENAVDVLAAKLGDLGVKNIAVYDTSMTHPSYIVSEAFRCSHIVFAAPTYNAGIFVTMETALHDIVSHNIQNRTVAVIENGSWAAMSGKLIKNMLESVKNTTILESGLTIRSALKDNQEEELQAMAEAIASSLK